MKILVTGCPKSGTTYTARMLQRTGMDIGHEFVKSQGTVSGVFFIDHNWYPTGHKGQRRKDFEFDEIWNLVRNPLDTIPSLGYEITKGRLMEWYGDIGFPVLPENEIISALRIWVCTHEYIWDQVSYRFMLEDIAAGKFFDMKERLGLSRDLDIIAPQNVGDKKKFKRVSWESLFNMDEEWAKKAMKMANEFGYTW